MLVGLNVACCWAVSLGFELLDGVNDGVVPLALARAAGPLFGPRLYLGYRVDRPIVKLSGTWLATPT